MFGKRDENAEVGPSWERLAERDSENKQVDPFWKLTEGDSFDEVARGLASGAVSRGRALKLIGTAILGAALVPFLPDVAEAASRGPRCPRGGGDGGCRVICEGLEKGQYCLCVETSEGEKVCVHPVCKTKTCDTSAECQALSPDLVCAPITQECCATPGPGDPVRAFCVQKCKSKKKRRRPR